MREMQIHLLRAWDNHKKLVTEGLPSELRVISLSRSTFMTENIMFIVYVGLRLIS